MRFRQYDGLLMLIRFILLLMFALYVGRQLTEITMNDMLEADKVVAGISILT